MATLSDRLDALRDLLALAGDRLPEDTVERARRVAGHADARLAAGAQTVAALAGATGSGKSSLFNALTGSKIAEQGTRRPTTSVALAASFTATNAQLLDLLRIPRRHEVEPPLPEMAGLILLDLPDHDSTQRAHREEVDRLIRLVDRFVFVLDPQKYADAAIHRGYLQPLAPYRDAITVVLNHADRLSTPDLKNCLTDLSRLLAADGLEGVPVFATSAVTGFGIPELRAHLAGTAADKKATVTRLEADLDVVAGEIDGELGHGSTSLPSVEPLLDHMEAAAGVPVVVDTVGATVRHRGALATGWPFVSWAARLRPDPLRRLRLAAPRAASETTAVEDVTLRTSLPRRAQVTEARLGTGLRAFSREAGSGMPSEWREAVDRAVHRAEEELPDALDSAVAAADLGADARPGWWAVVRVVQWLLILVVAVGVVWLLIDPSREALAGIVGGVVGGILLSLLSRGINASGARRARARAAGVLRQAVAEVAEREILAPVRAELTHYVAAQEALRRVER
ncbi:MAG TPA: 50S ribosome-binding GTPase [Arachnia sp.]|nr:50S ribosome-binding GTPase [Arachnia sp.]HMT87465.1 50S ribosome-binding GTPase [Arachnia sp.]